MTKGRLGRLSDHTGHNASKRRAGLETHNAEADPPLKRGRLPAVGKRATRAPTGSAGVLGGGMDGRGDWTQHGKPCRWRGTRQPTAREGQVGPTGWRRGPQYQGSRVMPVEGRDLSSRAAHDGGRDMRTGERLTASERVQRLPPLPTATAPVVDSTAIWSLPFAGPQCLARLWPVQVAPAPQRRGKPGHTLHENSLSGRLSNPRGLFISASERIIFAYIDHTDRHLAGQAFR